MFDILLWVAVGVFVGWNLPQPAWAVWVQDRVVGFFKKFVD